MKKLFVIAAMLLSVLCVNAQSDSNVVRHGKTFTEVRKPKVSGDKQTEFMYEIKDSVYPIWITKNGRCYIIRTSKKTGNEYKQYLCEDVARQICKELGVTYVEKESK